MRYSRENYAVACRSILLDQILPLRNARILIFVNVRTDKPYVQALIAFFRARERRLRH